MKASEVVYKKIKDNGNHVWITLLNGDKAHILTDGKEYFVVDKFRNQSVKYSIFDIVVSFLKRQANGKGRKGGSRDSKVGEKKCTKDTVMYAIATEYYEKHIGESCYDPVFVIAAMLDWAGIAKNGRGYIQLFNPSLW